ncbi:MAG: DUF922 domain-containing protein [Magnetococcales bacterium]|nr:DUF922 domain-containing protein [Magnetococcales bacterium]
MCFRTSRTLSGLPIHHPGLDVPSSDWGGLALAAHASSPGPLFATSVRHLFTFLVFTFLVGGCSLFEDQGKPIDADDPRLHDIEHVKPILPAKLNRHVHIKNISYPIQGRSVAGLNEAMQRGSPCKASILHHESEQSIACTQSRFSLVLNDASPEHVTGLCRSESFQVRLRITLTLPEWTNPEEGAHGMVDAWAFFHRALTRHEEGHAHIAIREFIEFEQAVDDAFAELPENACADKQRIFVRLWKIFFDKIVARNREYDRRTAHGVNNGTSFY